MHDDPVRRRAPCIFGKEPVVRYLTHPVSTYVHVLEGTRTVEFDHGFHRAFEVGQAFLDVIDTWHNGKNLGPSPLKFLVVFAGEEGKPYMLRPDTHWTVWPRDSSIIHTLR